MRRNEYPSPIFMRQDWQNLNGLWDFEFDDENRGHREKWYAGRDFSLQINVPFCFQSELSNIHTADFHDHIWYRRKFRIEAKYRNKRVILHCGAIDYISEIYINQKFVFRHRGGFSSFQVDITDYLNLEEEEIVIYVFDPSEDKTIPRGKQYWKPENEGIWYTRTSGIWQTVWLEFVEDVHLDNVRMTPDIDTSTLKLEANLNQSADVILQVKVFDKDSEILSRNQKFAGQKLLMDLQIPNLTSDKLWSPDNPYLFDIEFKLLKSEKVLDEVKSYFGMRKIHSEKGLIYLNNKPYYQKLVLNQGYYERGLLTAPEDSDYVNDILMAKKMGFNGCRKHQKVSDPRFLYHADRLGFLVWGEMANSFAFSFEYVESMVHEWIDVIKRDYNHPSIITWVPINESWGVQDVASDPFQKNHLLTMYHLTRSLDNTRLVISNDGWEMAKTDVCGIHNYRHGAEDDVKQHKVFEKALRRRKNILSYYPADKKIYIDGYHNEGEPIILTEFGGISYAKSGWGYTSVNSEEKFLKEYRRLLEAIKKSDCLCGFCYTQFTDVYQEQNGLLTFSRKPKVNIDKIREINDEIPTQ